MCVRASLRRLPLRGRWRRKSATSRPIRPASRRLSHFDSGRFRFDSRRSRRDRVWTCSRAWYRSMMWVASGNRDILPPGGVRPLPGLLNRLLTLRSRPVLDLAPHLFSHPLDLLAARLQFGIDPEVVFGFPEGRSTAGSGHETPKPRREARGPEKGTGVFVWRPPFPIRYLTSHVEHPPSLVAVSEIRRGGPTADNGLLPTPRPDCTVRTSPLRTQDSRLARLPLLLIPLCRCGQNRPDINSTPPFSPSPRPARPCASSPPRKRNDPFIV